MKTVTLRRLNDAVLFESTDNYGIRVLSDGSTNVGGIKAGSYPTNLLLTALGSCTGIDVVSLLAKMRQPLEDIEITIEGTQQEEFPRVFTSIHIHYIFTGDLKKDKVERAIELSKTKYCTVSKMIDSVAEITSSFEIRSAEHE